MGHKQIEVRQVIPAPPAVVFATLTGAVAGLASREGVEVVGMEAAAVSYPGFAADLELLSRGRLERMDLRVSEVVSSWGIKESGAYWPVWAVTQLGGRGFILIVLAALVGFYFGGRS